MQLIFCSEPFAPAAVDHAFEEEWGAAANAGLGASLIDFERIVSGRSLERLYVQADLTAIYRGWMLEPATYERLHGELAQRGVYMINDPQAYRTCHYLPESYRFIESATPATVWLAGAADFDRVMTKLVELGDGPVIVKDYVKSQKHYWDEACYIPDARDRATVERVVGRFLELQGGDLAGGLVFRRYVRLRRTGVHPKSGMPLSEEYRIFWLDHEPLVVTPYWDAGSASTHLPIDDFRAIAARVPSRFFSMDVAVSEDGRWLVIELGDGQVSGLQTCPARRFYDAIASRIAR